MQRTSPDLSVIIVNWNTRDLTAQCLASAYRAMGTLAAEVIVVDNASDDYSVAALRDQFPRTRFIENHQNLGFATANNQAITQSTGEYILLLNSDTVVQGDALVRMIAFMRTQPEVGIAGAHVMNSDQTSQRWAFGKFPNLLSESVIAWGLDTRAPLSRWFGQPANFCGAFLETDWVLGAALMIQRAALDKVGMMDENYFMYSEEVDLCYRIKQAGWRVCVVADAHVIHLMAQSTNQNPAKMKAELFRSKARYFQKHHGPVAAACLKFVFATSILSKRWAYRALGRANASELWAQTWKYFVRTNTLSATAIKGNVR